MTFCTALIVLPAGLITAPVAPSNTMLSDVKVISCVGARVAPNRTVALSRWGLLTVKLETVPISACACAKRSGDGTFGAGLPGATMLPGTRPTASAAKRPHNIEGPPPPTTAARGGAG